MSQPVRYFHRDLSWLSFNYRVLKEAEDEGLPLYERIKFLAIFASNLDEFFRVRVAAIQSVFSVEDEEVFPMDFDPQALLKTIQQEVERQQEVFGRIFRENILPALAEEGIYLLRGVPTLPAHLSFIHDFFDAEVKAFLHPELLRKKKIVHFLRDDALYLAIKLRNKHKQTLPPSQNGKAPRRVRYALIQIPTHYFRRFISLPVVAGQHTLMFLDDVVRCNLERIFPGYEVLGSYAVKLTRNADLLIEDEYRGDLVEKIREGLRKRKIGAPARFLYDPAMPKSMLRYLQDTFDFTPIEMMSGGMYHNFKDFFDFPNPLAPALDRPATPPQPHPELQAYASMLTAIKERDRVLHFPYHAYDYVIRFLNQAATDPAVVSVRATQYRVASNSAVVNALIRAAQNGKDVTVFVELKARFDEAANLRFAQDMERAGVKIIYSIPGLKVHAKVALIQRKEDGKLRGYAFLSTGNFNEKTARIYADHGFFTAREELTGELGEVFRYLENQDYKPPAFRRLLVAQFNMRERFIGLIQREIDQVQAGHEGKILIKLNNLEDRKMIDKLYEASQAGVEITLIIRGICCLRPEVPGLSDNIRLIRLVDQFLEHARVSRFYNGGQEEMYLGSADWMKRNLSRRIEVVFPVEDAKVKAEINEMLHMQLCDNTKAMRLNADLENVPILPKPGEKPFRMQLEAYERIREAALLTKKA
jgi:polyphosphate kinase